MILNREQIDNYWRSPDLTVADLRDTARAYHALRDAVLALCDTADANHVEYLAGPILDRFIAPSNVRVDALREVVARVERGGHDPVS